jgi:hypothetical protein
MAKTLTVAPRDVIDRLLHLRHRRGGASIQGLLHHRLLRTGRAPKGRLQARISSQPTIDFSQAMGPGQ